MFSWKNIRPPMHSLLKTVLVSREISVLMEKHSTTNALIIKN